ncbi:heavy metal-associated isoprenylated plant protein 22-like isoform X2 [Prosopis cineraria]|uniref:heavy metal-associated isoprenylated plant protein 22-like isoform X2 n=1 Tax=Prosopis cineraria TaxID=364024 RepID=UPI00240F1090|nr:heavy metal-associated isoprenylated plant protein 22-like isoform X2 [Prosopis cineraria]
MPSKAWEVQFIKPVFILFLLPFMDLFGVESVDINQKEQRVTVRGHVDRKEVIKEVKSRGKSAEAWPFVDHELVPFPYQVGAYDIKAPNGFVRNVPQALGDPKSPEMKLMVLFNDDNPNACSIM